MKMDISKLKEVEKAFGQFEVGRIMGDGNHNYFRFGYWRPVDLGVLQEIMGPSIVVVEDDDYDEDCGWKYSYTLYEKWEWELRKAKREREMAYWKQKLNES